MKNPEFMMSFLIKIRNWPRFRLMFAETLFQFFCLHNQKQELEQINACRYNPKNYIITMVTMMIRQRQNNHCSSSESSTGAEYHDQHSGKPTIAASQKSTTIRWFSYLNILVHGTTKTSTIGTVPMPKKSQRSIL